MQIVCTSPLPDRCTDYLLEIESPASLNLIKLKSQFQKPQNRFRKFILNILFLEPLLVPKSVLVGVLQRFIIRNWPKQLWSLRSSDPGGPAA